MEKKDVKILSEFDGKGREVADDVNSLFPIDTEDNILKSIAFILSEDGKKVYSSQERLSMLDRILDKSKQFNNKFLISIQDLVKGGDVEKIFTEAEVQAKAEKLAKDTIAKKEDKEKMDTVSAEVEALKSQIAELTKNAEIHNEEKQKVKDEKTALEEKLTAVKDEQTKSTLAATRIKELDYNFGDSEDYVTAYLKTANDEDFSSFKKLLETVAKIKEEKTNEAKTDDEKKKEAEEAKAAKKNLTDSSEEIPNNPEDNDKFSALTKALGK
jgi:hypothetical protein